MTFDEYQKKALTTDSYDTSKGVEVTDPAFMAKVLGLVGESGEVAEKFKKIIRNKNGEMNQQDKQEITKELGDTLWYMAVIARYLDCDFEMIAKDNLQKLADRQQRNVITSQGDNR